MAYIYVPHSYILNFIPQVQTAGLDLSTAEPKQKIQTLKY